MEGKLNNIETERVGNSQVPNNNSNERERSLTKQIEEILFPENLEINNLFSIIEADKFSFKIVDFVELEAVKSLSKDKNALLAEMKYIRFIEFSKDDTKCFLNYDKNTQIFTFSKLPCGILGCQNDEIYEKLNLRNRNKNQDLEILRLKKCKKNNKMSLVVSSCNAILKNQNFFSNLKFVQDNNILIESQDIEAIYDKIRKADPNSAYNVETKNLKAEKNAKSHNMEKITSSRHNSGTENLSWRKVSNENNKEYSLKTNFYNSGYKKNSFANGKSGNSNFNNGINNHNSYTKHSNNDPNEIKRERFNSETVGNFSYNNNKNGKFNQKNFHKNSFSTINNVYFSKNLIKNNETAIPTLTNNPLSLINKNFSNEIEIDTSKIKYHLQIKFKYTENDIDATYEALKKTGIIDEKPVFINHRSELISEKPKGLNKNFFSKNSLNNINSSSNNYSERANIFQTYMNNAEVKNLNNAKNLVINDLSFNNPEKNGEENKENWDKKKIGLNVNSPKFTRKSIANDIPTFNPLSSITMPYNKFDEFDPSAN